MSKYDGLGSFLREQRASAVPMSFADVERVIGQKLPRSARFPAWWSNHPSNNVMTKIWLAAGFKTAHVNVEAKTLVFRRAAHPSVPPVYPASEAMESIFPNSFGTAEAPRLYSASMESGPRSPQTVEGSRSPEKGFPPFYGSMKGLITILPGVDLTEPADPGWGDLQEKTFGMRGKKR
jgi:hypothetical protein